MIGSFADSDTELLAAGGFVAQFQNIADAAARRISQLEAAQSLDELTIPKGNRLKRLKGSWQGYYSIRVNDQWRIVFRWAEQQAWDVSLIDYH